MAGNTRRWIGWASVIALLCAPSLSQADEEPSLFDPKLAARGWTNLEIPGEPPIQFLLAENQSIEVHAKSGVSIIYRTLSPKERNARHLGWRWRVDKAVPATDPAIAGYDDRDLAVHLWFPDQERRDFWAALGSQIKSLIGFPKIGKVLTYAFGGSGLRHQQIINPHLDPDGVIILLRPSGSQTQKWFTEQVDIATDFERAFGMPLQQPIYLAISADSDDTQTESLGRIADMAFSGEQIP